MDTFELSRQIISRIPLSTVWLLNDLSEHRGRQDLFTKQAPQRLEKLRAHALIESAVASNRIEGVEIDRERIETVIFGKSHLRDRNEQEVRGYQEALSLIHEDYDRLDITPELILKLHAFARPEIWDSGKFKEEDGEIIEKHPDGRVTVRFLPLPARETPEAVNRLCAWYRKVIREKQIPPLIAWAVQNLDFLCIHPFRDGNGRVSRLLLLLSLYRLGFTAGRYISIERIIEQSKERYYATLQESSAGWRQGQHDPWPYVNYLLYTLRELYSEFERRLGGMPAPRGEKAKIVIDAIRRRTGAFTLSDLEKDCPGVGRDWIRTILFRMKKEGKIFCSGRGRAARWKRMTE